MSRDGEVLWLFWCLTEGGGDAFGDDFRADSDGDMDVLNADFGVTVCFTSFEIVLDDSKSLLMVDFVTSSLI